MTAPMLFAAAFPALWVGHQVGDYWVQTNHQAQHKAGAGWPGRWACTKHVATLTVGKALLLWLTFTVLELSPSLAVVALALGVDAVTHYWADRRTTLRRLADLMERGTGKGTFWRLGEGQGHLGTGAMALDQSWHHLWLLVAALIIAGGA